MKELYQIAQKAIELLKQDYNSIPVKKSTEKLREFKAWQIDAIIELYNHAEQIEARLNEPRKPINLGLTQKLAWEVLKNNSYDPTRLLDLLEEPIEDVLFKADQDLRVQLYMDSEIPSIVNRVAEIEKENKEEPFIKWYSTKTGELANQVKEMIGEINELIVSRLC